MRPPTGPLLRSSRRGGRLDAAGMTAIRISERVRTLGACDRSRGRGSRPRSAAHLGDARRQERDAHRPAAGRRRMELAGDAAEVRGGGEGGERRGEGLSNLTSHYAS